MNEKYIKDGFIVTITECNKFDYDSSLLIKDDINLEGVICDWNGYKFWVEKDYFYKNWTKYEYN